MSCLRSLALIGLCVPASVSAEVPTELACTFGRTVAYATIDASDRTVTLVNGRKSGPQQMPAVISDRSVDFDDGEQPIALSYVLDRGSLRLDRFVSANGEKTHLDRGRCRAATPGSPAALP